MAAAPPRQTVFFEPSFTATDHAGPNEQGFPQGFLRVAFDHYFTGANPRRVIDPSKPAEARQTIGDAALAADGAWLVTIFDEDKARTELPAGCFRIERKIQRQFASLYHVVPTAACQRSEQQ